MPEFSVPPGTPIDGADSNTQLEVALRFLIAAEQEAVSQYTAVIRAAVNPVAKQVLANIRDEEKRHTGELRALLYSISPEDRSLEADGQDETESILIHNISTSIPH